MVPVSRRASGRAGTGRDATGRRADAPGTAGVARSRRPPARREQPCPHHQHRPRRRRRRRARRVAALAAAVAADADGDHGRDDAAARRPGRAAGRRRTRPGPPSGAFVVAGPATVNGITFPLAVAAGRGLLGDRRGSPPRRVPGDGRQRVRQQGQLARLPASAPTTSRPTSRRPRGGSGDVERRRLHRVPRSRRR